MKTVRASACIETRALLAALSSIALLGSGSAVPLPAQSVGGTEQGGLLSLPDNTPIRGMSNPSLSPDGKTLCFVYLGDLWTVPVSGGAAIRLTVHEALDTRPRWSPDGKFIAFTSTRTGSSNVFLVPAEGGSARQVTFYGGNAVADWSPDGMKLLFTSYRDTHALALYSIDLRTRALKRLTNDEESLQYGAWSPDGKTIAYIRAGQPWWRPWYKGSVAASTVLEDITTGKVRTLLKSNNQQFWPSFSADGKVVYMATIYGTNNGTSSGTSNRTGNTTGNGIGNTPNLYRVPVEGGKPVALTHYTTDAVRWPSIARNGSLLTYIYEGDLYTIQPDGSQPTKVPIIARSDDKVNNQEHQTLTQQATESELSPDGKQLALVIRGDLWLVPVAGGDAKRLTDNPANDADIAWSPDNNKLVFISDRGNQPDLYTIDVKTKALTRLTNDPAEKSNTAWSPDGQYISYAKAGADPGLYIVSANGAGTERKLAAGNGNNNFGQGISSHAWSPDSKWVAFSRMDRFENIDLWVVPTVGGAAVNVTRYPGVNIDPQWTKDGRRLLFLSSRPGAGSLYQIPLEQENDAPTDDTVPKKPALPDRSKDVKIDFDDIHLRAKSITNAPVTEYMPLPDSQRVVFNARNNFYLAPITGIATQPLTVNGEPGSNIHFTPDGSRFFYLGANGTPRSLSQSGGPPTVVAFTAELVFDRRLQYQQAFNEFYRKYGAAFYDSKMHGVNWHALRDKYEPLLKGVGTPEEFASLLSEMVGEVNSSHSEIGAAIRPSGPRPSTLGIFYDDSYTGPGVKVSGVMPKGPADKPSTRVNPGDYILAVDGSDVTMNEDFYQTLQDKAEKTIELLVNNKPGKEGARTLKLKPITLAEWQTLEYEARVRRNRELVDKLSNNRIAYLHIKAMNEEGLLRFERELYSDALYKDGLILDIRGNGGGNTHDALLEALSRHVYGYKQPRDGQREMQPTRAWTKPIVLLADQNSYSDAEVFPAGFRSLKLGKIVGVPTPGYVIFTAESQLLDGTTYRLPSWAWYSAEGKNLENLGIPPDIYVENTPEDMAGHRDRQLEVAVETLLKEMLSGSSSTAANQGGGVGRFSSANDNPNGGSSAARGK